MRRATIRTEHDHPELLAAAIIADNTDEIDTRVEFADDGRESRDRGGTVVTVIQRETTGGLRTTVDDYVTNLTVAQRLIDYTHDTS